MQTQAKTTQQRFKAEATERGIDWQLVKQIYDELRTEARESRRPQWELRQACWRKCSTPGCWDFWRHGMHVRFKRAFSDGDRELIPRFDEVAQELAEEFPELAIDGDPAERLFDEMAKPHNTLPSAEELYCQALDLAADAGDDSFEFGTDDSF